MSLVENVDLSTTPATPPPPGVVPDFDNPESLSYLPRSLMYAFVPLMVLFLGLRLWCRWKTKQKLGWDDYSGITSVASTIAYCGVVYASFDMLYGVHLYEIPVSDLDPFWFEMLIVICILSGISLLLVKLALLVLYLRVFRPIYSVRLTIYSCIGILSAFYFATCVAYLVQCVPETSQNVAVALNTGTCIPSAVDITVVRNFFGAVSDFVILIIPINQVFKLGLVRKKKFAVVGTFMTGLIACGCSLATCLVRIGHTSRDGYGDYTWANTVPVTFTIVELTVGNICCSLPILAPLVTSICHSRLMRAVSRPFRTSTSSSNKGMEISTSSSVFQKDELRSQHQVMDLPAPKPVANFSRRFSISRSTRPTKLQRSMMEDELDVLDMDYHAQLKSSAGLGR